MRRVADQPGILPEALRTWARQDEIDSGEASGVTTADTQKIADLEREVRDLRRWNEILKSASRTQIPPSPPTKTPVLPRKHKGCGGFLRQQTRHAHCSASTRSSEAVSS
ncbi:transposase [Microbacterium sp. MPKO10]|uniref:transposase n=1 Tax=Microbacterium sp. MPKO10 TaxID=2989818 RepID=UPI003556BF58